MWCDVLVTYDSVALDARPSHVRATLCTDERCFDTFLHLFENPGHCYIRHVSASRDHIARLHGVNHMPYAISHYSLIYFTNLSAPKRRHWKLKPLLNRFWDTMFWYWPDHVTGRETATSTGVEEVVWHTQTGIWGNLNDILNQFKTCLKKTLSTVGAGLIFFVLWLHSLGISR